MKKTILLLAIISISFSTAWSQNREQIRIPLIGDKAISFKAESTNGNINFPDDFGKMWKILVSHPKDFTPVCSSELLELAAMQSEFKDLNAAVIVLSTDKLDQHKTWIESMKTINYRGMGMQEIKFPLVADENMEISMEYGMIHPSTNTTQNVRGVFIISPDNIVKYVSFYPMEVGRNTEEIKRTLVALQTVKDNIITPANWKPGDDVMLSYLNEGQKEEMEKPGAKIYQIAWFMTFMKL